MLWDAGTTGISELPSGEVVAGFDREADALAAARLIEQLFESDDASTLAPIVEPASVDWFDPNASSLVTVATPDRDISFSIVAGSAFGHGGHPSTDLILRSLHSVVTPGCAVLDIGTGSGVLAIASKMLGANRCLGIDIDPAAIEIANTNAAQAGVAVDFETTPVTEGTDQPGSFDVVLINVLLPTHRLAATAAIASLTEAGKVVASGFLSSQSNEVRSIYQPLVVDSNESSGDWAALTLGFAPTGK